MKRSPPDLTALRDTIVDATTKAKRAVAAMKVATAHATDVHDELIKYAATVKNTAEREELVKLAQQLLFAGREFTNAAVQIGSVYKHRYRPLRLSIMRIVELLGIKL